MKTALILGSTGQVGQHLLKELLASPHYNKVGEFGRRVTSLEILSTGNEKLEQHKINFDKLDESGLKDGYWDDIYITLGTTRKAAGSATDFEKIDREFVLNAAKEVKKEDPARPQRVLYVSCPSPSSTSMFLYPRSKGLTEEGLTKFGFSEAIMFRPGMLLGVQRPDARFLESAATSVMNTFRLTRVSNSLGAQVSDVAKAMILAGTLGAAHLPACAKAFKTPFGATAIGNAGIVAMAAETKEEASQS
ncbi:hypothetical protein FISHEDRAFT_46667 [Fistulina hepatica ATCC 64428]|uniref:NAD(P)-binding domain-containing protein n=1 Tax=Fistulina hepatica ATCC 64428 TaxID=1128425 RepID=A0A0D7A8L1_9AGAR|nr:hypothetical protein FISHEDRAFT_46667 [Fistulina hepatica ATCC 64428]